MVGNSRATERAKRHRRIRRKVRGTGERPRLCVTKTTHHLYAQVIDDDTGTTLAQISTIDGEVRDTVTGPNIAAAKILGSKLAERATTQGVKRVVFDRGGYPYHGVVSAFADACREGGLEL